MKITEDEIYVSWRDLLATVCLIAFIVGTMYG